VFTWPISQIQLHIALIIIIIQDSLDSVEELLKKHGDLEKLLATQEEHVHSLIEKLRYTNMYLSTFVCTSVHTSKLITVSWESLVGIKFSGFTHFKHLAKKSLVNE